MCTFKFYAPGRQGYEYSLTITVDNNEVTFQNAYNSESISINNFKEMSIDYNQQYGTGKTYLQREIIQQLNSKIIDSKEIFNFIRVFMCFTNLLFRHSQDTDSFKERVLDEIEKSHSNDKNNKETSLLSDFLFIDWNGTDSVQPQFYFVPKSLENKNLDLFVSLRMLNILEISIDDKKEKFYYVPFDIPSVSKFAYLSSINVWNTITNSINKHVRRITGED